ncbi:MAG: DMT family transporter [Gemmobacter sp.]|jgi:drug/metabolite transporter (DMT)-like permease|nr:DMT family transporter [Gemmobacter sp.]
MTPFRANLILLLSMLSWAAAPPAAGYLIGPVPPLPLTFARIGIATAVLLPLWLWREGAGALTRAPWARALGIGAIGLGACGVLLVMAQAETDAVTVAVISATAPVIGMALECLLDGRPVTLPLIGGIALSVTGGLLSLGSGIGGLEIGLGMVYAFSSVLLYTIGSRLTITALPGMSPLGRTTLPLIGALAATGLCTAMLTSAGGPAVNWPAIGPREVLALCIYGIFGMAISQLTWIAGVGHLGIGTATLHMNAAPFYVMVFLFLLGDPWNWVQVAGAALVAAGVLLAQTGTARRAPVTE